MVIVNILWQTEIYGQLIIKYHFNPPFTLIFREDWPLNNSTKTARINLLTITYLTVTLTIKGLISS